MTTRKISLLNRLKTVRPNQPINVNDSDDIEIPADLVDENTAIASIFNTSRRTTVLAVARVIGECIGRAQAGEASLSPFFSSPLTVLTKPSDVVEHCNGCGYTVNIDMRDKALNQSILSKLSGIPKGTLSSVNSGQMHFNVEDLDKWRKALVIIGESNKDKPEHGSLSQLADRQLFLDELISDYRSLYSLLPVERIRAYASEHELGDISSDLAVGAEKYYSSMCGVWRNEILTDTLPSYEGMDNIYEILQTKTRQHRFGRSFKALISTVHTNMAPFSSRVRYPSTNFQTYKQRYCNPKMETALTADILISYCFFLGINPLSLLYWLASDASKTQYDVMESTSSSELIAWCGTISPSEYSKFLNLVLDLRLVSDQERWVLSTLAARFVFGDMPDEVEMKTKLASIGGSMVCYSLIPNALGDLPETVKIFSPEAEGDVVAYQLLESRIGYGKLHLEHEFNNVMDFSFEGAYSDDMMAGSIDSALDKVEGTDLEQARQAFVDVFGRWGAHMWQGGDVRTYKLTSDGIGNVLLRLPQHFYNGIRLCSVEG